LTTSTTAFKSSRNKSTALSKTMDSIMIDATTGVVGVKTLIWHIMPQLHSSSVLKGVHRALEDSGASMDTTLINGRFTKTATVALCCTILDNMRGETWQQWRQSSGPAFKRALRERVASVVSSGQVEQAHPPAQQAHEQHVEGVEKKAVVLRKALRAMNIEGSVRVDERTGMVSDIDVIKMLCPEKNDDYANIALGRVIAKDAAEADDPIAYDGTRVTLADRVKRIQINGKGRTTPVSDAPTAIEIIWLLPARAAREFRKQSADTIARVLGGDVSLCAEIEQRCARLQNTDEGRAYQSFMTGEAPAKKHKSLPEWFEYATSDQKSAYVAAEVKKSVFVTEIEMHEACKVGLESVGQFSGRDEIEYADRIRDTQRRASRADNLLGAPAPSPAVVGDSAMLIATPIDNSIDPETGKLIATHKVSASVRGPETSICVEAAKLGISTGERAGQVGKVAKRLYGERYGGEANRDIPTRHTTFRGKPFVERAYFSRDADLIQQAIRIVCCPGQVSTP
ncbi:unnamed protein product, partial [Ectocarpus sp. 8 AP-2014]